MKAIFSLFCLLVASLLVFPQEAFSQVGITSIKGKAYADPNENSVVDAGEVPLAKKKIYLEIEFPGGRTVLMEATTDADGNYEFRNIPAGYIRFRIFAEVDQLTLVETPYFTVPPGTVDFQINLPVNPSTTFLATSPSGLGAVTAIQEYRASQNSPSNPKNKVPVSPFVP